MSRLCIVVEFEVDPNRIDAFLEIFLGTFVPRSQAEEGCELYELWRDEAVPHKMTVVERWTTRAHHDAHMTAEWFKEWHPVMEACLIQPPGIRWMYMAGDAPADPSRLSGDT